MKEMFASAELGTAGLLFFFIFFCVATIWTFRPGKKEAYQKHGNIPLKHQDDQEMINE